MEIQYGELDNGIRMIKLIGTLDVVGTGEIETKFSAIAREETSVWWWTYPGWISWPLLASGCSH